MRAFVIDNTLTRLPLAGRETRRLRPGHGSESVAVRLVKGGADEPPLRRTEEPSPPSPSSPQQPGAESETDASVPHWSFEMSRPRISEGCRKRIGGDVGELWARSPQGGIWGLTSLPPPFLFLAAAIDRWASGQHPPFQSLSLFFLVAFVLFWAPMDLKDNSFVEDTFVLLFVNRIDFTD